MNKPAFKVTFLSFMLNALLIFAGLLLILPFLAQPVQDIHPALYIHFYKYYFDLYTIVISI
ncbi:hypothetical protein CVD28_13080 [Bacillus sp. M6-12]|nr:hypothetical protein CVD28_13080 [Bacillus sp. M6-12]